MSHTCYWEGTGVCFPREMCGDCLKASDCSFLCSSGKVLCFFLPHKTKSSVCTPFSLGEKKGKIVKETQWKVLASPFFRFHYSHLADTFPFLSWLWHSWGLTSKIISYSFHRISNILENIDIFIMVVILVMLHLIENLKFMFLSCNPTRITFLCLYRSALSMLSPQVEKSSFSQVLYVVISSFSNILKSEVKNTVYHKLKTLFKR